jgi:hypothetical protein
VNTLKCDVTSGELAIRSDSGLLLWRGLPDGYHVRSAAGLSPNEGCVVLLAYEKGPKNFRNLLLCRPDGVIA